jgi:hypothetical protein
MRDSGTSHQFCQPPEDNEALSARPTERAGRPGAGRPGATPDAQHEVPVPENPGANVEMRPDRTSSETDSIAGNSGDHPGKDGKRDPKSTAAEGVAEAGRGGETACRVDASKSKSELYRDAKDVGIEGRSAMNKEQLIRALREHQGTSSSGEQATRGVSRKGRHTPMRREPPPEGRPPRGDIDSGKVLRAAANARGPDRCAIVYKRSHLHGEFEVVVTNLDGSRRSVARSPAFRSRSRRAPRWRRAARVAHELLAWRLEACGWRPVDSSEGLHELRLVRAGSRGMPTARAVVTLVREAGRARFLAEELDTYGNPTALLVSPPFTAHRLLPVRPLRQARAALREVVTRMEYEGWKVAAAAGKDWYAISLWRPVRTDRRSPAPSSPPRRRAASPHEPSQPL